MATDAKLHAYIRECEVAGTPISKDWLGDGFYSVLDPDCPKDQRHAYLELMEKFYKEGTVPIGPYANTLLERDDRPAAEQWKIAGGLTGKEDRGCLVELKAKILKSLIG